MTIFCYDTHHGNSNTDVLIGFQTYQFLHLLFENQIVKVMHMEKKNQAAIKELKETFIYILPICRMILWP